MKNAAFLLFRIALLLAWILPGNLSTTAWGHGADSEESISPDANGIVYVKKGSTGNGSNWENAVGELADALKWAGENSTLRTQDAPLKIYVARGTYNPLYKVADADLDNNPTTDRDKAFVMVKNVQLYGGFDPDNGMTDLAHRSQVNANATILSGDLSGNDAADIDLQSLLTHSSRLDNAYHVVLSLNDVGSACLDGFTITGGNGDKDGFAVRINGLQVYRGFGGGISIWSSSPTIRNIIVRENSVRQSGAGIYTSASEPVITHATLSRNAANQNGGGMAGTYYGPKLTKVSFENNLAKYYGGGFYDNRLNARLKNVVFQHNSAGSYGGAVYSYNSSSEYMNVSIHNNAAGDGAGAMFNSQSPLRLTNVTITENSGTIYNAGIYNFQSSPKFVNCIIWGNTLRNGSTNNILNTQSAPEYGYSLVQGSGGSVAWRGTFGTDRGNNLDIDPAFTNVLNGDFSLADGSLGIGAGSTDQYISAGGNTATDTDLAGNPRLSGANIDLGAYESQEKIQIRYVRQGGVGFGHTWETASGDLQAMINASEAGNEVWVAAGEYQPASGQSFSMKEGIKIYGGFAAAGAPAFADRNWNQHAAVLKGNGSSVIVNDNNGLTNAALLDGFTITGGSAVTGGGMLNHLAYPLLNHCVFKANHATVWGGGIYNDGPGMTTVVNSLFYQNTAQSGGAAFSYQHAKPRFTNVTMAGNTADQNGGALHNYEGAESELVNSIVWANNQSSLSSQLYTVGEGKTKAYFSVLEGGADAIIGGKEAIDVVSENPLFNDGANGNFTLQACSPAQNIGTGGILQDFTTDLNGNSRIVNGGVDAGAYEYQGAPLTDVDRLSINGHTASVDITAGQTYYIRAADDVCRSVAVIASNGASPVSGMVNLTTHIDQAVQTYNGSPYVQRHYDISPVNSASAATARITLYFTQSEFTAYNTSLGLPGLPSQPDGSTGSVRVFQYHGSPKAGESGPGAYTGARATITPDVAWNSALSRWEVSFDVNGFSGFFIGSADAPLPVKLVSFEGALTEANTVSLQWRVTGQLDMNNYTVEHSYNGRDFTDIGRIPASRDAESRYQFMDVRSHLGGVAYYKLRMTGLDGSYANSWIVRVMLPKQHSNVLAYPIPAHDFVRIKGKDIAGTSLKLIDIQGVVLKSIQVISDDQKIDVSSLPAGVYYITTNTGNTLKIVKN